MKEMYTDSRYKNSHKKSAKIFAKAPCKVLDIKPRSVQNSQLHSFTASQLHSFTASQLHSFTASQLHSFTAEAFPCPNKFTIKHKQIYSHKKPQRPQSVELRSTSQRNNRHVLGIGTRQSKPLSRRKSKGIPNNNKTARTAKDYKRMSYEASLKTLCVLGVLRG